MAIEEITQIDDAVSQAGQDLQGKYTPRSSFRELFFSGYCLSR